MYCVRNITKDICSVGGSDRRLALFENMYPIPNGITYNSYFIDDEQTAVVDTVDKAVGDLFLENIAHLLNGRALDYVLVNHMEPDHGATLALLCEKHPEAKIVCNAKAAAMVAQFFDADFSNRFEIKKEGESLTLGRHKLTFYAAPMVHWPEVTVTFDETDGVLFSADAFGTFGATDGSIFADEVDFGEAEFSEMRRYYTNIVGKYGAQTLALLKKAAALDIKMICPLHGPVWRKDFEKIIEKYQLWGAYTPEEQGVLIAYGSVYGNTQNAAELLAARLSQKGVKVKLYDVSVTHPSYLVAECFKMSHLVFAAPTYNSSIFTPMETLLLDLKAHSLKNRTVAVMQNGSWAATCGKQMRAILEEMQNITVLEETVSLRSSVKESNLQEIDALCDALYASLHAE